MFFKNLKTFNKGISKKSNSKSIALYYKLDSAYKLAINSVPAKMQERLENAKNAYGNLVKFNASTEFKSKADEMLARIENDLKQFSKIN